MNIFKATILTTMLTWVCSWSYGQTQGIDVPKDSKLLLHVYARGVQIYVCAAAAGDSTGYAWTLSEAKAELYTSDTYRQEIGKHYFNAEHHPVWELPDSTKVVGNKLRQVDAPVAGAVPWLLLRVVSSPDAGMFRGTTFIQRINTRGGKAPEGSIDPSHKGKTIRVEYTAEYLFYSGN